MADESNSDGDEAHSSSGHKIGPRHVFIPREKYAIQRITEKYDSSLNYVAPDKPILSSCDKVTDISNKVSDFDVGNFAEGVSDEDIMQVEMFFRSHRTDVYVCQCLANLYFGPIQACNKLEGWRFAMTGIPVLVLDSGEHHRKRKLNIVISEKGTGFILWRDAIDHLTNYSVPNDNFHTMQRSTDHTQLVGLSFDDSSAAKEFHSTLRRLTSDPDDELLNISKMKKKKKLEKTKKFRAPKKTEISQPCCFVHVTKLERPKFTGIDSQPFEFEAPRKSESQSDIVTISDLSNNIDSKLALQGSENTNCDLQKDTK